MAANGMMRIGSNTWFAVALLVAVAATGCKRGAPQKTGAQASEDDAIAFGSFTRPNENRATLVAATETAKDAPKPVAEQAPATDAATTKRHHTRSSRSATDASVSRWAHGSSC